MSLILQVAWITQVSDWLTLNWLKLLGIFGGAGGFIAFITMIGKLLITCIQGHYTKKYNNPIQKEILDLKQSVLEMIEEFKALKLLIENSSVSDKEELKEHFKNLIEKSQKIKLSLYDKMVIGNENVKELLDELKNQEKETKNLINQPKEETVELPALPENSFVEGILEKEKIATQEPMTKEDKPKKKQKHKAKIVVER